MSCPPEIAIVSSISGDANITKIGPGNLVLAGVNSYTGQTTVREGVLVVRNRNALGSPNSKTVVNPDFLTSQVDSAADSMRQTEKAVSELQHLTGLADQLEEPPAILDADLRTVLKA